MSFFYEYNCLNYFLVPTTKIVFDFFNNIKKPVSINEFHGTFQNSIPLENERNAILEALTMHHLIEIKDDLIAVKPKGKEYQEWRNSGGGIWQLGRFVEKPWRKDKSAKA